jgi:hypothetical protein
VPAARIGDAVFGLVVIGMVVVAATRAGARATAGAATAMTVVGERGVGAGKAEGGHGSKRASAGKRAFHAT